MVQLATELLQLAQPLSVQRTSHNNAVKLSLVVFQQTGVGIYVIVHFCSVHNLIATKRANT